MAQTEFDAQTERGREREREGESETDTAKSWQLCASRRMVSICSLGRPAEKEKLHSARLKAESCKLVRGGEHQQRLGESSSCCSLCWCSRRRQKTNLGQTRVVGLSVGSPNLCRPPPVASSLSVPPPRLCVRHLMTIV